MLENSETGIHYGVQVLHGDAWHTRWGWFPENPRPDETETGLERAQRNADWALENEEYTAEEIRIVRRETVVTIVST